MRISSFDALKRGLFNLRANPALIGLQMVQGVVVTTITLAGLVPVVLAFGAGALETLWSSGGMSWRQPPTDELERLLDGIVRQWPEQWPLLVAALLAGGAVWTVGFLAYCWFQGGVLGQLASGEERACLVSSPSWRDFRVFSWGGFVAQANQRTWKLFWLVNIYLVVALILIFVVVLAMTVLAMATGGQMGLGLLVGFACLSMLFLLAASFVLYAWSEVGKAELVVGDTGVREAFRRSFATLWRRLGAVLLLLVLFIVGSVAIAIVFMPISMGLDLAIGDSFAQQIGADIVVMLIQTVVSAAVVVGLSSALISLVKGET